jgi:predicted nucleic acid-binding protein
MRYLLDTNVLSELSRDTIDPLVEAWFAAHDGDELLLSVITIGEIEYGIKKMVEGRRRQDIRDWFEKVLLKWFGKRVCPIDDEAMRCWADIRAAGRTLPILDSLIAATAVGQGAVLVTRNVKDFEGIDTLEVFNPFAPIGHRANLNWRIEGS